MPAVLSQPVLSLSQGGGPPSAVITGSPLLSSLVAGTQGATLAISQPVLSLAQGGVNLSPTIRSLFEIVIGGTNCPPVRRYPATGQRGSRAWTLTP
jgi:hypothetical protein